MKKYLEKLKTSSLSLGLWKTGNESSMDSPESGWSYKWEKSMTATTTTRKRGCSPSNWVLIGLPILAFLCLGIYFVVVDVKVLTSDANKSIKTETNSSETTWWETSEYVNQSPTRVNITEELKEPNVEVTNPPEQILQQELGKEEQQQEEEEEEEDPNLIVRFDYLDVEDLPTDGQFLENVLTPKSNSSKETIIILKNDDSGKKIFLKTSATFREIDTGDENPTTEEGHIMTEGPESKQTTTTTTRKPFVYSPTIPQATAKKTRVDTTTNKYNQTEDSGCFSTKLDFCEGILPYDVVQLPNIPGVKRYSDLASVLPYFQMIVDSGCSLRAREFICSVLEPECQPEGSRLSLPCKLNCKVVSDDCKDFILQTLPLSKIFDCRRYPDWDESQECVNVSKGKCHDEEFQCSDGTCIPLKWVCDGVHDCPGSRPSFDENNCQGCSQNEFRCVMDGKCVPQAWRCDGTIDCTDHSDEMSC